MTARAQRGGAPKSVSIMAQNGAHTAGFTLIEALVVTAVLAVLAVGIALGTGVRGRGDVAHFVERFDAAQALAVQGRQTRGFYVTDDSLQAAILTGEGWLPLGAGLRWQGTVTLSAEASAFRVDAVAEAPEIVLLPTGESTVFDIRFGGAGQPSQRCASDGWRGVQCDGG